MCGRLPIRSAAVWSIAVLSAAFIAACAPAAAKEPATQGPESAIRATAQAFVEAFDCGDAKAIAALFTDQATVVDDRAQVFKGRKAIEAEYAALFKQHPGVRMEISIKSIDFPAATMAVEEGTAQLMLKETRAPVASRYTAVHVLEGGKWRMASVRESAVPAAPVASPVEGLAWLIGVWENEHEGTKVRSTFRWIVNKTYIERDYSVQRGKDVVSSGVQIIGWCPQARRIRSWSFDSSGGHGTGLWSATGHGWRIDATGVLADGTATSSRELLIRVPGEDGVLGWRSFDRKIGNSDLPPTAEIVLDRAPAKR